MNDLLIFALFSPDLATLTCLFALTAQAPVALSRPLPKFLLFIRVPVSRCFVLLVFLQRARLRCTKIIPMPFCRQMMSSMVDSQSGGTKMHRKSNIGYIFFLFQENTRTVPNENHMRNGHCRKKALWSFSSNGNLTIRQSKNDGHIHNNKKREISASSSGKWTDHGHNSGFFRGRDFLQRDHFSPKV